MTLLNSPAPSVIEEPKPLVSLSYLPLVERNTTNGMNGAERERDRIYDLIHQAARGQGVELTIVKSDPFVSPPKVVVDCWVRHPQDPLVTLRSNAVISVRPREFHHFPYEYDIEFKNDVKKRAVKNIIEFVETDAYGVVGYLLSTSMRKPLAMRRRRSWAIDLWRPRNRPGRLGMDPRGVIAGAMIVLGIATLGISVGVALLPAGLLLAYFNRRRRTHCLSAGRPDQEPRRLIRLDSWQVVVDGLGPDSDELRSRIISELKGIPGQSFDVANEKIWYWGSDGKEEREQTVVRLRRGLLFLHIYQYGESLYIGWDAHVNCGEWIETLAANGYDKKTGTLCAVHSIAAGWHVPNEYDITDTNCLIEQVHAIITRCVKLKSAERKIDQEIDFKIVREARGNISGREEPGSSASTTIKSRLRRLV